jgi:hypothetical protein
VTSLRSALAMIFALCRASTVRIRVVLYTVVKTSRAETKAAKLYDAQTKAKGAAVPGTKRGKVMWSDGATASKTLK